MGSRRVEALLRRLADYRPDGREKLGRLEWLHKKVMAAARAGWEVRDVAGYDHCRGSEPGCAIGYVDAVAIGEEPIGDHEAVMSRTQAPVRIRGTVRCVDLVPHPFENEQRDLAARCLVIDQQNPTGAVLHSPRPT